MERGPQTHVLGRLVLEPAVRTPERVSALWDRLGRLGAGELAKAIEELCSRLVAPDQVIRLDRLVIDAGRVREDRLEEDLIEGTRRALTKALLPLVGRDARSPDRRALPSARGRQEPMTGGAAGGAFAPPEAIPEQMTRERRLAESVRFLLAHGALPWWHSAAEPDGLDELVRAAVRQSPDETRRALVVAGQEARARRRLALQLPTEALHEIVRLIEAGHAAFVIDYVVALEQNQAEAPFVPATTTDFRVATWELVLAYLLVEHGSQFNRKMFVSGTIAAMARHFGLGYGALLSELHRALPRVARATEPLRTILDELWDEHRDELWDEQVAAAPPSRPLGRKQRLSTAHGATEPHAGPAGESAVRAATRADESAVRRAARRDERLALLSALLARGLPPAESVPAFDETFRALQQEPGRLRWVLLAHWHRERVRQRLAERPDELLTELVHVVIPAHAAEVVSYGRTLQRAHATRPILRGDAASFRRARWRFFLDTLVLQHGSAFNTRAFIRVTLERLAAHHNTTYDALVPWLWRELGDLPRSPAGAHPVVVHLGALYRELRARRGEATRSAAPPSSPTQGSDSRPSAHALLSLFDLIPPDQRTITAAVVRFVETLPELATHAFGRGLPAGAIAVRVRRMALGLLRARRARPLRPAELLDGLIDQVAQDSGVPREHVLRWALRRKAQRGSVRDEVRGLVEQAARASGIAWVPAQGSSSEHSDGAGEDPVRALTGFLLRGTKDARPGRGDSRLVAWPVMAWPVMAWPVMAWPVMAWIDRIDREGSRQVRSRIVELLRDASARRRLLAAAGNAALTRLWAWRRPEQREAVNEAVDAIEDLGRVLASSRHERALREAFWQFLWTRRASRARRGAQLLALFVAWLARREPRLVALLRSSDAGDRMVERALAGGARMAAPKARVDRPAVTQRDALMAEVVGRWKQIERDSAQGRRIAALLRDRRARRQVLVEAGDDAMVHLWSWQRPAERDVVREAIDALGHVLSSSRYRGASSVSLREAFWQFMWSARRSAARRSDELLARFFDWLAQEQPKLLALLRAGAAGDALVVAGERLMDSVPSGGARTRPKAPQGKTPPPASREGGASRSAEDGERGWLVRTAGVVLVWSLLQRYFERLGLVEGGTFRDLASQERACGLIHFLASGQTEAREPDLVLGKVLCGLDVEAPVPVRVEVDEAMRALSESLLGFVLTSWKGIGGTTIQGLRGTFLCRDGRLSRGEGEDRWAIDVERKTYDILLSSFPWQTSVVKLPWMPQPLFVHWR